MVPDRRSTLTRVAAAALALSASVSAVPAGRIQARDDLGFFDDVLLFDAPGVSSNPSRAEIQAYTYVRQFDIDLGPIDDVLGQILNGIPGLGNLDDYADRIAERTKLFLSVPRTGKEVDLTIDGCGDFTLRPTSKEVDGVSITPVTCKTAFKASPVTAAVDLDSRGPKAKIFVSPPDGFGVISDLDDTIKISNVLDKVQLVKNTFIEDPKPVPGMPELYSSLKARLNNPLFSYISGSPFQLYPFIHDFLSANYPGGPAFLRNITVFDIPNLVETLTDSQNTFKSKLVAIDRLVKLYPAKKFLMIGDSTEQDPEIYAEAFKRYPSSVQCIWIRAVEGANNAATRWTTAFGSVPGAKVRVFTDAQIGPLKDLDVPNGKC